MASAPLSRRCPVDVCVHSHLAVSFCLLFAPMSAVATAQERLTKEQIIKLMRDSDVQFNNIAISYDYTAYRPRVDSAQEQIVLETRVEVDPDVDPAGMPDKGQLFELADKFMRPNPTEQVPEPVGKWVDLLKQGKIRLFAVPLRTDGTEPKEKLDIVTTQRKMALRWPDFIVHILAGDRMMSKYGSFGQNMHTLYSRGERHPAWFHKQDRRAEFPNVYQEDVVLLKFCFGLGFAQYLKKIDNLDVNGDGYHLTADFELSKGRSGKAELFIDDALIVRRAEIDVSAHHVSVTTSGRFISDSGWSCAKSGTFQLTRPDKSTERKFEAILVSAQALSNTEFASLADMTSPEDQARYEDEGGRLRQVRSSAYLRAKQ